MLTTDLDDGYVYDMLDRDRFDALFSAYQRKQTDDTKVTGVRAALTVRRKRTRSMLGHESCLWSMRAGA